MPYEDIYKGLTEEEKERMLKMDIPKFEVVGEFEMTEQEKEKSRKDLLHLIKNLEKNSVALNWYIYNRAQWEKVKMSFILKNR